VGQGAGAGADAVCPRGEGARQLRVGQGEVGPGGEDRVWGGCSVGVGGFGLGGRWGLGEGERWGEVASREWLG
jgi:hypothetical protein